MLMCDSREMQEDNMTMAPQYEMKYSLNSEITFITLSVTSLKIVMDDSYYLVCNLILSKCIGENLGH